MKTRSLDATAAALAIDAWPTLEPDDGFADRVLVAYDAATRAPQGGRRWPLYAFALAVAGLLAPLLVAPRTPPSPPALAQGADLDLGHQTD